MGDDADGQQLMEEIARAGGCGFATNADDLANGQQMAEFVKKVFVGEMMDSDGDGVPDSLDKCPKTPAGVKVDASGCPITILGAGAATWTFNNINFEVAKADIKSSSYGILDEIVAALKARPALKVLVEGHTDSTGARSFSSTTSMPRRSVH